MNKTILGSLIALSFAMSGATPTLAQTTTFTTPAAYGTTSSVVTRVQQFLADKGFLSVKPTGYYGDLTAAAVERFQIAMGISPTYARRVGPLTLAALNDVVSGKRMLSGTTSRSIPAVRTLGSTDVTATTALISGMILASEQSGSVTPSFTYGTSMAYGSAAQTSIAGNIAVARLTGLSCGTTYHYKFSVTNSVGTSNGGDAVFTTLSCGA